MAWLSIWIYLQKIGLSEAHIDSCACGLPHRKPFRLLGHGFDVGSLNVRCSGGHKHVRIEGKFTKASAAYHPNLAAFIAKKIAQRLKMRNTDGEKEGTKLESVVLNDLLQSPGWKVESGGFWKKPVHINILGRQILCWTLQVFALERRRQEVHSPDGLKGRQASNCQGPLRCQSTPPYIAPSLLLRHCRKSPSFTWICTNQAEHS